MQGECALALKGGGQAKGGGQGGMEGECAPAHVARGCASYFALQPTAPARVPRRRGRRVRARALNAVVVPASLWSVPAKHSDG